MVRERKQNFQKAGLTLDSGANSAKGLTRLNTNSQKSQGIITEMLREMWLLSTAEDKKWVSRTLTCTWVCSAVMPMYKNQQKNIPA